MKRPFINKSTRTICNLQTISHHKMLSTTIILYFKYQLYDIKNDFIDKLNTFLSCTFTDYKVTSVT